MGDGCAVGVVAVEVVRSGMLCRYESVSGGLRSVYRGASTIFGSEDVVNGVHTGGGCASDVMTVKVVRSGMPCGCEGVGGRSVGRGVMTVEVVWSGMPCGCKGVSGRSTGKGVMTVGVVWSGVPCGCNGVSGGSVDRGACISFGSSVMVGMGRSRLPLGRLPR